MCSCTCVCVCEQVYMHLWRLEDNREYHYLGAIHSDFWDESLTDIEPSKRQDWLPSGPQGFTCLCLPRAGIALSTPTSGFLFCFVFDVGFWAVNLGPQVPSTFLTELSSQGWEGFYSSSSLRVFRFINPWNKIHFMTLWQTSKMNSWDAIVGYNTLIKTDRERKL